MGVFSGLTRPRAGPRLRVAVLKAVMKERGFKFKPVATLSLVEAVLDKTFPEQPVGMTVLPDGSVYYQMKRVKRQGRSS